MIIIPVWFYGFDATMYFISALVGFLLSFYFHRLYSINSEKTHKYLYLGFLILSIGLMALSISDMFSYVEYLGCHEMYRPCILSILDNVFSIDDYAYLAYFGLSLVAYFLFIIAYSEKYINFSKMLLISFVAYLLAIITFMPMKEDAFLWYSYSGYFHLTAFIMLTYVSLKNIAYYTKTRRFNSFLVAFSFSMISLFHLLHIFASISGWVYVLGHIFLLIGFISLLSMVLHVKHIQERAEKKRGADKSKYIR